jgi:TRAP-type C4-dicarboxylate transport system permease small subunit
MGIAYLAVCVGFTLMAIRLVQDIILIVREMKALKKKPEEEGK